MQLSCGGKIFILGEYACLEGGPSIIGTIAPSFTLNIVQDDSHSQHPIPFSPESPAGLYLATQIEKLNYVRLLWNDPYDTPIGVGSSSAQFILSIAAIATLKNELLPPAQELLKTYWQTVGSTQGLRPSGADVLAQWFGGPIVVRNSPLVTTHLAPWKGDSTFLLAYTGKKAKTHEHLKKLRARGFPESFGDVLNHLNEITLASIEAWEEGKSKVLGSALSAYQKALTRGELAPAEFSTQLEVIQNWPGVLGCKGSGAQGGDCVLLLVEEEAVSTVSDKIAEIGWTALPAKWLTRGIERF